MSYPVDDRRTYVGQPDRPSSEAPLPGQHAVVMLALSIGILMMGIQLWLLTVTLDLFLSGQVGQLWRLALVSGLIFAAGAAIIWLLHHRPHVPRTSADDPARLNR